ncbi:ATP-binding cassette domain-containing protein [Microbacterium sp.]|uniref:ATP-binding cassette domain-containing protein n=1 Tax=Microbacterium sp. TaxID=51671 RepID=UPI0028A648C7|nr:ATP-binding cassette domain-containing protein [Microbacterium sp.]
MPEGQVLEFTQVTKRFGAMTAVSDLSVRVEPGAVTGFLGPNGAGKTTSLRILLGQIRPTSGSATIGGASYADLRHPLRTVGAVLEESAYRPRRTASRQLLLAAKANGIPAARVGEVLHLVGLQDDGETRLGSYSLGMRQRLAVASALLGDPGVLVLDEPANGLDPEGIRWMRLMMRRLADEGRTVLVSSHVLSEIEQVADDVVVLSKGRAVHAGPISELADASGGAVVVDAENRAPLITALSAAKLDFDVLRSGVTVRDSDSAEVGAVAAKAGVALTMLQQRGPSLEEVFLDLVYGRRADSPRLDTSANRVAHASDTVSGAAADGTTEADAADADIRDENVDSDIPDADAGTADAALVAGGVPLAGAAAVVADGGAVAAAGTGYGAAPTDTIAADLDASEDGGAPADTTSSVDDAEVDAAETAGSDADTETETDAEADASSEPDEAAAASAVEDGSGADADHGVAGETSPSDETRAAEHSDDDLIEDAPAAEHPAEADGAEQSGEDPADAPAVEIVEGDEAVGDLSGADRSESDGHAAGDGDTEADHAPQTDVHPASDGNAESDEQPEAHEQDDPHEQTGDTEQTGHVDDHHDADHHDADQHHDAEHDDSDAPSDETRPLILPLATDAVTLPSPTVEPTFTELITGLPASVTTEGSDRSAPATEAISIVTPELSSDDDDDAVDDGDDDPRLAAMRTSLLDAASRFFDGPAPDYPYSSRAQRREESAESNADDASARTDGDSGHDAAQHHGDQSHH